jgi:class 3 adenylate cyclase
LDENVDAFFKMISSIEEAELSTFDNTRFKFAHDRIRQASLVLVEQEDLELLNLKAARIKVQTMTEQQLEEESFTMAHHYNSCENLIDKKEERDLLVHYNYKSGLKAKSASAYQSAIDYFNSAKAHITFKDSYALLYDIYLKQAECLYLNGQYDEAETALDTLYGSCKTNLDRLNTLFTKVYLYNIQDKKLEALEAGRIGYALYGIKIPSKKAVIMFLLLKDILKAKILLPERKIPSMLDKPLMMDEEQIRFQEFLLALAPTIYQYDQKLFGWNIMRMFFATLKYGNNGISSFCYIGYGMMISQLFGKYTMGKKLADLAMDLNNKLGYTALKWKVRLSYFNFVHHWTEPVRPDLDKVLEVENGAYANGDPIFAGYAIFIYLHSKFVLGFKLEEVLSSYENYLDVTDKRKDAETQHFLEGYYYAIRCLIGLEEDTLVMGSEYNAPERIREAISFMNFSVVADIHIAYMQTLFMFGHFQKALETYLSASKYIDFVQQRYEFAEYNFYAVLICSAAARDKIPTDKNLNKLAKKHLKNLKTWSELCPNNFEPQYLLAAAESASINQKSNLFNQFYEKAILSAESYGFINYKALAGELAGRKQYALGNRMMAETYLMSARKDYYQWGALAKVKNLEQDFKDVFKDCMLKQQKEDSQHNLVGGMDLSLIMKATQAVKSEKDIDSLVEQLMKVIIQYSSADKGSLLVKNRTELIVKARYSSNVGVEAVAEEADSEHLPLNIIKYVMRVKTYLILNNPSQTPEYSTTRYFTNHSPKSVICYPILKQGDIFGVLYLENYSHEGVFDEKKVNMLNIISSQVAVSLDNAYLYDNLETQILERTKAITAEKGIVDEMLENILPKASIDELKRTGKTTAQKFEGVTVLMADIKGFTKISERLTPEELISKIDFYFSAFDAIMQKYHLEKIKTIGDAYMAAGGLKGNTQEAANNMVNAAIEMQQCMYEENKNSVEDEKLEMRIGIHTGPVIAGVVGLKRFQYDIWGDTVNVAARMEQQSVPGRINVSKETFNLTNGFFELTYRGKIEGKNKGLMDMYFVESNEVINENPSAK